ncbi:MAG: MBOAT family protein [Pseudomonadales bacterium]|nr:MBOAT family protein [Pseudomonadales bacterium]
MIFSSYIFVLAFLPLTVCGYWLIQRWRGLEWSMAWLTACSLFYYGWWNPVYLLLIGTLMLVNYGLGLLIHQRRFAPKLLMIGGVAFNLIVLGYFKYMDFFISTFNDATGSNYHLLHIVLPLGISFFTFQKIAFLVDSYHRKIEHYSFLHYCLFVTFFPQLIAGPIVHYRELMPEFLRSRLNGLTFRHLAVGLSIFAFGLFKKSVIADNVSAPVGPVFNAAAQGVAVTFFEAWGGLLAYTAQLYFDFSGYSDMAIGLALLFGVRLPLNFFSPYKSRNIVEFWRRWHITLSSFLRDYLYITLGGNRHGKFNRYRNLFLTMLIGGLWHGAAWNFVLWGALHGAYLVVCHGWTALVGGYKNCPRLGMLMKPLAYAMTFFCIAVSMVFFRADNLAAAWQIVKGLFGVHGIYLYPGQQIFHNILTGLGLTVEYSAYAIRYVDKDVLHHLLLVYFIIWFMPNVAQIFAAQHPVITGGDLVRAHPARMQWAANVRWALLVAVLLLVSLLHLNNVSEFLYFRF